MSNEQEGIVDLYTVTVPEPLNMCINRPPETPAYQPIAHSSVAYVMPSSNEFSSGFHEIYHLKAENFRLKVALESRTQGTRDQESAYKQAIESLQEQHRSELAELRRTSHLKVYQMASEIHDIKDRYRLANQSRDDELERALLQNDQLTETVERQNSELRNLHELIHDQINAFKNVKSENDRLRLKLITLANHYEASLRASYDFVQVGIPRENRCKWEILYSHAVEKCREILERSELEKNRLLQVMSDNEKSIKEAVGEFQEKLTSLGVNLYGDQGHHGGEGVRENGNEQQAGQCENVDELQGALVNIEEHGDVRAVRDTLTRVGSLIKNLKNVNLHGSRIRMVRRRRRLDRDGRSRRMIGRRNGRFMPRQEIADRHEGNQEEAPVDLDAYENAQSNQVQLLYQPSPSGSNGEEWRLQHLQRRCQCVLDNRNCISHRRMVFTEDNTPSTNPDNPHASPSVGSDSEEDLMDV